MRAMNLERLVAELKLKSAAVLRRNPHVADTLESLRSIVFAIEQKNWHESSD
jgi:hypothetical protein